jgi:tetraacyldisaccharide 4'-kinase
VSLWWRREEPRWARLALSPLVPLSWAFGAGARLHRWSARPQRAARPVISIGNLAVGGAGKTPVTILLAERLLRRGLKPAVLSRGYKGRGYAGEVSTETSALDAGDEPVLIKRRCPQALVFTGKGRGKSAAAAVERGADVLLLDDGLQHHALARELDVVVIDASNPFGNGRLLPRGPLRQRELPPQALVWLTRCDLPRDPRTPPGDVESAFAPLAAPDLHGKRALIFAGIARPESFVATVRGLGAEIVGQRFFADHHRFAGRELETLRRSGAEVLVTTEKDLVRIDPLFLAGPPPIVAVPVELRISRGEDALDAALARVLR